MTAMKVSKTSKSPTRRQYIGVRDAAEMLSLDRSTLYRLIAAGELPAYRISDRRLVLGLDDIDRFMLRRRTMPVDGFP
jgi:excisionase family DNA binding protein